MAYSKKQLVLDTDAESAPVEPVEKTWRHEPELAALIRSYRKKEISSESFYTKAYPLIHSYCRYAKNHSKVSYFTNDILENITQGVMIIFFKGLADKIDLEQNFLGYLYRIIMHEVYQFNREQMVVKTANQKDAAGNTIHFASVTSLDEKFNPSSHNDIEGGLLEINAHEFAEYDSLNHEDGASNPHGLSFTESLIDKESALNKIANLIDVTDNCLYHVENKSYKQMKDSLNMQKHSSTKEAKELSSKFNIKPLGVAGVSKVKVVKKPTKNTMPPSKNEKKLDRDNLPPEKKILFDVQEALCLTVQDLAEAIGITIYVMNSYLYRDEVTPKPWVVESAKELLSNKDGLFEKVKALKAEYGSKTMSEILVMWSEKLGFNLEDTKFVAEVFGTTPPTILRWKNNQNKPTLMYLSSYYETAKFNLLEMQKAGNSEKKSHTDAVVA